MTTFAINHRPIPSPTLSAKIDFPHSNLDALEQEVREIQSNPELFRKRIQQIQTIVRKHFSKIPLRWKTELCQSIFENRACRYEHTCNYAHSLTVRYAMLTLLNSMNKTK